jgi:hypothetical protein
MLHCPGTEKPVPNGARYGWVIDSCKEPDQGLSPLGRCRKMHRRGAGGFRAETAEERRAQCRAPLFPTSVLPEPVEAKLSRGDNGRPSLCKYPRKVQWLNLRFSFASDKLSMNGWVRGSMSNKRYFGDNLHVLREHIADASVDLVYLDPPFNSNAKPDA